MLLRAVARLSHGFTAAMLMEIFLRDAIHHWSLVLVRASAQRDGISGVLLTGGAVGGAWEPTLKPPRRGGEKTDGNGCQESSRNPLAAF